MHSTRTMTMAAAATVAGLLGTACGDDAEALSKPEFIEQADAICTETNAAVEPIFDAVWESFDDADPEGSEAPIIAAFADAIDQAMPHFRQQLDDLRALAAPEGDEELLDTMLDDFEAAITEFEEVTNRAAAGDQAALAALEGEAEVEIDAVNRRAREYGFRVCGEE